MNGLNSLLILSLVVVAVMCDSGFEAVVLDELSLLTSRFDSLAGDSGMTLEALEEIKSLLLLSHRTVSFARRPFIQVYDCNCVTKDGYCIRFIVNGSNHILGRFSAYLPSSLLMMSSVSEQIATTHKEAFDGFQMYPGAKLDTTLVRGSVRIRPVTSPYLHTGSPEAVLRSGFINFQDEFGRPARSSGFGMGSTITLNQSLIPDLAVLDFNWARALRTAIYDYEESLTMFGIEGPAYISNTVGPDPNLVPPARILSVTAMDNTPEFVKMSGSRITTVWGSLTLIPHRSPLSDVAPMNGDSQTISMQTVFGDGTLPLCHFVSDFQRSANDDGSSSFTIMRAGERRGFLGRPF